MQVYFRYSSIACMMFSLSLFAAITNSKRVVITINGSVLEQLISNHSVYYYLVIRITISDQIMNRTNRKVLKSFPLSGYKYNCTITFPSQIFISILLFYAREFQLGMTLQQYININITFCNVCMLVAE